MPIGFSAQPASPWDAAYRWIARLGSRWATDTSPVLTEASLRGFRRAQRLAYDCVETVGTQLRVGMTEIEAATLLEEYLAARGCNRYLHRPFAWFGEHARFDGYRGYADYHPSERRLREGEAAILDVSPMVDGHAADVGFSLSVGDNPQLRAAQQFLLQIRAALPPLFDAAPHPSAVWLQVDRMVKDAGYDNIHARYPFAVLGHHVFNVKAQGKDPTRIGGGWLGWFSLETNLRFLRSGFSAVLSPENEGSKTGLWAIEPHIGWNGGGAKFEELLIVDERGARWLDDEVPHLRHMPSVHPVHSPHEVTP
jgi:Xaa-Pro aminopeptidase